MNDEQQYVVTLIVNKVDDSSALTMEIFNIKLDHGQITDVRVEELHD